MGRIEAIERGMTELSPLSSVEIPSLEGKVSEEEWKIRVDLAAAYRLVAHYGWDDLIFTHLSARVPGPEHHFLLNPYNLMFEEVTASSLVKVGMDGLPVEPSPFITNPAGFTIHSAIHMAREDAHAVIHLHTPHGQAVSAHGEGLLPLTQTAMLIRDEVAYHDYEGVAVDLDERERIIADLGDKMRDAAQEPRHARGRRDGRRGVHPHLFPRARLPGADPGALGRRGNLNNPPQGAPEVDRPAGQDRPQARRRRARLAGAAAEGLPPRSELRDLTRPLHHGARCGSAAPCRLAEHAAESRIGGEHAAPLRSRPDDRHAALLADIAAAGDARPSRTSGHDRRRARADPAAHRHAAARPGRAIEEQEELRGGRPGARRLRAGEREEQQSSAEHGRSQPLDHPVLRQPPRGDE